MLFNSTEFLFMFLPLCLLLFHTLRIHINGNVAITFLMFCSLLFYGWWNPPYLLLLVGSILLNYYFASKIFENHRKKYLVSAITINLLILGYFKYKNFFLENINLVIGRESELGEIFIPLGISFFTFQQIAFLIDAYDTQIKKNPGFLIYAKFISFFPQLIAGPIVLYSEVEKQLLDLKKHSKSATQLLIPGFVVFIFGLFKKVVLADGIAPYADTSFNNAYTLTFLEAWAGSVCFALQLYFDFSGYSDMAVGLGLMFGIVLPLNFDTPFRACSMIDFWKRWHITMTRFFMMYIYSPIALSFSRYINNVTNSKNVNFFYALALPILITFLLSGLWHGAGWNFIIFGLINGFALLLNHYWKEAKLPSPPKILGRLLTFIVVLFSFVYFRSSNVSEGNQIITSMLSPTKIVFPDWLARYISFSDLHWGTLSLFSTGTFTVKLSLWLTALLGLSILLPNIAKSYKSMKPNHWLACCLAFTTWLTLAWLDEPKTFLYFQF